ncbi:helix-turn-helix transcriptional regulator [Faecalicatena contorta]|uniref:Helix-turn-helix transcriptional regulator n=1 Tax=Faecalicatena fissicatena TaxID=290055 RepID=A0ABS2E604_9FIRM|nr:MULTISPECIES: AraC family transcriptional regulator [Clostridia]MBM6684706.1 helix-turn-helix transcriptional regulator [Faecalicatena contorta]MBM6709750.1 helix-turn-helix transcriptional regulator [Faecalicatena contorta]MBM6737045.1 helix-turn-helix transcriptional regulator [Faecalicatena fissicatena]
MKDEFEVISHGAGQYKVFMVNLLYRTPHIHKDFEICLLLEGTVCLLSRGREHTYEKGSLWVINPFTSHELIAKQPALILSLQISPSFFGPIFPQIENMEFSLEPHSRDAQDTDVLVPDTWASDIRASLAGMLLNIASAYFHPGDYSALRCAGLICLFFERLPRYLPCVRISEKERQLSATRARRVRKISSYIDSHYSEKLLLTDLAQELGLSMSYLSHFFKSVFGMSFQSYVMKMRCEKARQLLLLTDFSLLDISIACGFSDIKYFNQGFRRQFGCSPRQYRQHFEHEELSQQQKSMLSTQEFLSPAASRVTLEKYLPGQIRTLPTGNR